MDHDAQHILEACEAGSVEIASSYPEAVSPTFRLVGHSCVVSCMAWHAV